MNWLAKRDNGSQLDPDMELALREMAGWPLQTRQQQGHRHIHRTTLIYRDALGNVTHSVEQIDEDGYEGYSNSWGK